MCLLVFAGWALAEGITGLKETVREGLIGITPEWNKEKNAVILVYVEKNSAADKAGLKTGDTILALNGQRVGRGNYNFFFGERIEGEEVKFTVKRGDAVLEITVTKELTRFLRRLLNVFSIFILPLVFMIYCAAGLWATFKKPRWATIRIALVCFFLGTLFYTTALDIIDFRWHVFSYGFLSISKHLLYTSYSFFPFFWLFLFLYYPEKADFKRVSPRMLVLFSLIAGSVFYIYLFVYSRTVLSLPVLMKIFHFAFLLGCITLGLAILARGTKKAATLLQKRQYRLLEFGLNVGILFPLLGAFGLQFISIFDIGEFNAMRPITQVAYYIGQLGAIVLPYTFFNFLGKSRLVETTSSFKRKVIHAVATVLLFTAYLVSILTVGDVLVSIVGIRESKFIILFTLLVAVTFYPINRRVLRFIEHWIFPERTRYRQSLRELAREMQGIIDWHGIEAKLNRWFDDTMNISPVILTVPGITNEQFPTPFTTELGIVPRLERSGIFFWDELTDEDYVDPLQRQWVDDNGISVSLPMKAAGDLVGLIHFGKKKKNTDFTGDDIIIFRDAAKKTAPVLQVLKLQSEQLEKARLIKELDVARTIQEQLMAPSIPEIHGFRLYGTSRSCLEMGGDYFDMISLDRHRVLLAVADVCGKGAGAALLMTNIQAALRIITRIYSSLNDIMVHLNEITCDNTNTRQFITLFAGILDNSDNSFEYVNAGHSPALHLHENGKVQQLTRTGIALGLRPQSPYPSRHVTFTPGDLLTIYTDGFDESFNPRDEMFGVPNIIKLISEHREHSPEMIADELFSAVKTFAEGVAPKDDLTLVIAKMEKRK